MSTTLAPDIAAALKSDRAAFKIFEALGPSHRREYLKWIDEAKKPDTRARRIASMIERLSVPQKQ